MSIISNLHISQHCTNFLGNQEVNAVVFDPITGLSSTKEVSIREYLSDSAAFSTSEINTTIVYKITDSLNAQISNHDFNVVNSIVSAHKYLDRVAKLIQLGYKVEFHSYSDQTFKLNLELIDSDLPQIIAHIVKDKYVNKIIKFSAIIDKLVKENPMSYDQSQGHKFYDYRLVNFLVEAALGMTSKNVWSGIYDIVGGIIIVKPNADVLCYHLIDFNKFKQYLRNSARLDNPSGSKMDYGEVYIKGNESFINLNFQVKA